jgi:hypothetical protein
MGYAAVVDQGVYDLVERANMTRLGGLADRDANAAEAVCRDVFGADSRIAVYGALAPGEAKHYMLTPVRGVWTLKQMRVESFEPGTKKVVSRTYLEIDDAGG